MVHLECYSSSKGWYSLPRGRVDLRAREAWSRALGFDGSFREAQLFRTYSYYGRRGATVKPYLGPIGAFVYNLNCYGFKASYIDARCMNDEACSMLVCRYGFTALVVCMLCSGLCVKYLLTHCHSFTVRAYHSIYAVRASVNLHRPVPY